MCIIEQNEDSSHCFPRFPLKGEPERVLEVESEWMKEKAVDSSTSHTCC